MKTKDWRSVVTPRALIVGENSTLQWSEEVIEYVMFLDYYFRPQPYDHGERSRYIEAKSIFSCLTDISAGRYMPQDVYATNVCSEILPRPPRGKHLLVPESAARVGLRNIKKILSDNPTIETVFVMSLQTNYLLQKLGFYGGDEKFLHGAQPRNIGLQSDPQYYQPVDAKVFRDVCGKVFDVKDSSVKVVPILPSKDYPLYGSNLDQYGDAYTITANYFAAMESIF